MSSIWVPNTDYTGDESRKYRELYFALREYLEVMATEPAEELIPIKRVYHDLRRILGDEE